MMIEISYIDDLQLIGDSIPTIRSAGFYGIGVVKNINKANIYCEGNVDD
jgi:hypothetical protein